MPRLIETHNPSERQYSLSFFFFFQYYLRTVATM